MGRRTIEFGCVFGGFLLFCVLLSWGGDRLTALHKINGTFYRFSASPAGVRRLKKSRLVRRVRLSRWR